MALPQFVTYATSLDGEKYGDTIRVDNPNNPNPAENPDISKISIHSFTNKSYRFGPLHKSSCRKPVKGAFMAYPCRTANVYLYR